MKAPTRGYLETDSMKITLYVRTYPVKDAPVALSLVPFPTHQRHTYTRDGKVYEAVSRELRVIVPDESVIAPIHLGHAEVTQREDTATVETANGFHADNNGLNGNGHHATEGPDTEDPGVLDGSDEQPTEGPAEG